MWLRELSPLLLYLLRDFTVRPLPEEELTDMSVSPDLRQPIERLAVLPLPPQLPPNSCMPHIGSF